MTRDSRIISIRLPAWLADELDADAEASGMNRSTFIKQLYLDWRETVIDIDEYITSMAAENAAERN